MSDDTRRELTPCGCCETASLETERSIKPGQPTLPYRVDTHATFLRRMLYRLHTTAIPDGEHKGDRPLESISTQTEDDPLVGILDAWACVGDVLTFYQERIANEGYLRTATERRSVLELARAIGYELSPGVAASTHLAFKVDDAEGRPGVATIPQGTQVQSLPEQGESPVTYETDEEIKAYAAWNEMVPRTRENQVITDEMLRKDDIILYLTGVGLDLAPGDYFAVFSCKKTQTASADGESTGSEEVEEEREVTAVAAFTITAVEEDLEGAMTMIVGRNLNIQLEAPETDEEAIAGITVDPGLEFPAYSGGPLISLDTVSGDVIGTLFGEVLCDLSLSASDLNVIRHANWLDLTWGLSGSLTFHTESWDPYAEVYVFRERIGFFGHNAPKYETLPIGQREMTAHFTKTGLVNTDPAYPESWDDPVKPSRIWTESQFEEKGLGGIRIRYRPLYLATHGVHAFLERVVEEVVEDSWALIEVANPPDPDDTTKILSETHRRLVQIVGVSEATLADYGLSSKCTGLTFGYAPTDTSETAGYKKFVLRKTVAYVRSERLDLAPEKPITHTDNVPDGIPYEDEAKAASTSLTLQGYIDGLLKGRRIALTGELTSPPGELNQEILTLSEDGAARRSEGYTSLHFQDGLTNTYRRDTVTLNANVVPATHGESVSEILGNGDGATPNQTFRLAKPPLTHTPAETETGSETTLEVRVDGILWNQAPFHYGLEPADRTYTVRIDNEARAHVIFGDGKQGARLPTGSSNVTAEYRSGIGLDGELGEDRLTLLKTKPPEVREVTNPVVAAGAEDPETLGLARQNAPLKVKTLERVVSLQDYEDFARTYAGIGKARASVIWNGAEEVVHITVGSSSGGTTTSDQNAGLRDAIEGVRDPREPVEVAGYDPVPFRIAAKVRIDDAYLWETVKAEIEGTLVAAFSFEQRAFGQPVTSAEVITRIHGVEGVIAVDLDELHGYTKLAAVIPPLRSDVLAARTAVYSKTAGEVLPAQLLLLEESKLEITEMTP